MLHAATPLAPRCPRRGGNQDARHTARPRRRNLLLLPAVWEGPSGRRDFAAPASPSPLFFSRAVLPARASPPLHSPATCSPHAGESQRGAAARGS